MSLFLRPWNHYINILNSFINILNHWTDKIIPKKNAFKRHSAGLMQFTVNNDFFNRTAKMS